MRAVAQRGVSSKAPRFETSGGVGPEPSDEHLMSRFCGDAEEAAFESLMHRYQPEILGYLRRYLGNADMAEDVCQATFFRVHIKRHSFVDGRRFRPWLYAIATNQAIDACRRAKRHRMVGLDNNLRGREEGPTFGDLMSADEATIDAQAAREESMRWMASAVQELPERMKTPLVLVYHQGMKYQQAAVVLGIPVGTVKSRLHAALVRLNRSWLESHRHN
jgi:RNA polymerase sigma-70 factor (ECF subfamily)